MYDTHCHLTFREFADRTGEVLDLAGRAGVRGVITVATSSANAEASLALAEADPRIRCTAGVHPLYAAEPVDWAVIRRCAEAERCVAWGELGLDRHYSDPPTAVQETVLAEHLAVIEAARADGIDKPVVVHCREAFDELVPILRASSIPGDRFVFHCFTAGPDEARMVLDFGSMISFTGVLTFRNAEPVRQAAALAPADRIMVETDAPFLSPEPHRKVFPCEPAFVVHVAERLAHVRGEHPRALERTLDANAERFFGLDIPALAETPA
jgi:TatD DNase family protein